MSFFDKNQDLIGNLSSKYRLNRDVVEKLVSHTFLSIKDCMGMEEMPNILIHNWGRFSANPCTLEKRITAFKGMIDSHPEKMILDRFNRLEKYINAYERVCLEEKRNPINCIQELKDYIKVNKPMDEEE